MTTIRMNLNVEEDVPGKLEELAGGNKAMGRYLTELIRTIHSGGGITDVHTLSIMLSSLSLRVAELERKVGE